MTSHRKERVGDLLRAELSQLLQRGLKDRRLGFVTVTGVTMSGDLRIARVHVSVLGSEAERAGALEALNGARGYLRREIGRALRLRYVPELNFHPDLSLEHGSRIDQLLDGLAGERPEDDSEE